MNYFDQIFNRLKKEFHFNTDKEMYDFMGIPQGTFTNWRRRNKIPYEEINTICIKYNLNLNFIINGNEKYQNDIKKINFEEETIKMIKELDAKKKEICYHLIKAESLKEKL